MRVSDCTIPSRYHYDANLDLLYLLVVRRGDAVQESCDLRPKVRRGNEGAQNVLWQHIGIRSCIIFDVVIRDVYVLQPKREMRSRDCADPPVRLAAEYLLFVIRCYSKSG